MNAHNFSVITYNCILQSLQKLIEEVVDAIAFFKPDDQETEF